MFTRARRHSTLDIWPGFVDAMATLLMVIVFVLMTFVVAQLYLTEALQGKDNDLQTLESQLKGLENTLSLERFSKDEAHNQIGKLQQTLSTFEHHVTQLRTHLAQETAAKDAALVSIRSLNEKMDQLNKNIERLNQALSVEQTKVKEQSITLKDFQKQLNEALLSKVEELKIINAKLTEVLSEKHKLSDEIVKLKDPQKLGLTQYRSEFFAKLVKVLGNRSDIRIVGDRFVFQSEVLFDKGSAEILHNGMVQLKTLAQALKDITKNIPKDMQWILRVDGHTDKLAISTSQFPSNWELSSARAIAVVKALIKEGIEPHHLVAASFGEYQPLAQDEKELGRNRRIEFKLDQR